MAKTMGVWGIDIGQCALKALRCHMEGETVVADAFDFIEYPKVLSQPDANPPELIKEALAQFLSRNDLKGDKVGISVPGQSGLARYFKPPPVDAKKIADIVKYEARQQIPFPLEDVIWDYQRMGGGTEIDGIALETEVGLFAMKREQVYKALLPYMNAGVSVDIIQLAPLCIYNYLVYDLLQKTMPPPEEFDPDKPPPSTVVVSIGTDTTDLVVTNGYRVWQRNIPLGGNHFTKQLTKELKHTFAKAEHLKRNAHQADDPKAIFQAMRPVFNDMVTELQRSLSFFSNLDRKAHIDNVVVLGNTIKLPGLKQYLTKHLGYNVIDFDSFERLSGDAVTKSPSFRDNLLAFGPCYGLCLQALNLGKLGTNLLPREITTERLIKAKKPWAAAAAAICVLGFSFNYIFHNLAWRQVQLDDWKPSIDEVVRVTGKSTNLKKDDDTRKMRLDFLTNLGQEVVGNADRRMLWPELLVAITQALPTTPGKRVGGVLDVKEVPFSKQKELHIESFESQYFPDLKAWFEGQGGMVKNHYLDVLRDFPPPSAVPVAGQPGAAGLPIPGQPGAPPATAPMPTPSPQPSAPGAMPGAPPAEVKGPEGPGWVIELHGYHFYNSDALSAGATHVRQTLIKNLLYGKVKLPTDSTKKEEFTMSELGIGFPIMATDYDLERNYEVKNPNYRPPKQTVDGAFGIAPTPAETAEKKSEGDVIPGWKVTRYKFVVQFVWQEKPLSMRIQERAKAAEEAAKAAALQPPGAAGLPAGGVATPVVVPVPVAPAPPVAAPMAVAPAAPAVAPMPVVPPATPVPPPVENAVPGEPDPAVSPEGGK